jgi:hypothetical protein
LKNGTGDHKELDQKWERARSIFRENDLVAELKDGALFGRSDQAIRSSVGACAGPGIFRFQRAMIVPPQTGRPGDYEKPNDGCKHSEGMGGGSEEAVLVRKEKIEQAGEPDGQKQP